jgi:hypothetical protein
MCLDPGMANSDSVTPDSARSLEEVLADAKATARDQLHAASQLQLDRLHEQLAATWHSDLERIFEERLAEAVARLEAWHQNDSGSRVATLAAHARAGARRDLSEQLGQAVRRLRQFESEEQWGQVLLDATKGFCARAALFVVNGPSIELRALRGIEAQAETPQKGLNVPLASAPAFASAVESRDTVVAMRSRGELSEAVSTLVGESPVHRSSLFPLTTRDRVPAVLYADSDEDNLEPAALEMLCSIAAAVLEGVAANSRPASGQLISIFGAGTESARPTSWFALSRDQQNLHLRAQRFARVQVAEMRLYQAQAVKKGRAERNLYDNLKAEIDAGREKFRKDFLAASDSMVDYFHLELLRTLANEDAALLGSNYPGPMV